MNSKLDTGGFITLSFWGQGYEYFTSVKGVELLLRPGQYMLKY